MKALTVCQPFAWAIVHGPKRIENRNWPTRYRGPLAIHAGLSRSWLGDSFLADGTPIPQEDDMAYGAIVGTANLIWCAPAAELSVSGDPFVEGPWCWVLNNVVALARPVRWRGRPGLFDVPDEILGFEGTRHE